ncbi:flagellar filament capping protein FliD [Myxococcota bacterium]|nr:flagellar filament capping protein FliD [Myxococcota bacterium]MBU1898742.1 flagellar filament capping protein FliD [Myxococcota bacterium]
MSISVGGIASGLDVDGIISQLLAVEQTPILNLQRKIAEAEARQSAYRDLDGRLSSLRSAVKKLNEDDLFNQRTVSVSDDSIASVSVEASAPTGTYSLEVLQRATAHRVAAQGFIDDNATGISAAAGTFSFKIGDGELIEIDVDESTTLRQLADAINEQGAAVRADIVNDTSATQPYRLVLTATTTGDDGRVNIITNDTALNFADKQIEEAVADAGNAADYTGAVTASGTYTGEENRSYIVEILQDGAADGAARYRLSTDGGLTFDDNGGAGFAVTSGGPIDLGDGVEINFTNDGSLLRAGDRFSIDAFNPELEAPKDAVLRVNGIQIIKSSNEIDDVFEGVTLNLKDAEPGKTISFTIGQEAGDVTSKLNGVIGAYNSVMGFLSAQFKYDPESGDPIPILNGDSAARQVQRVVRDGLTRRIGGLGGETLSALSELGVESNEETGLLSLNTGTLERRLREQPQAVARLLSRFGERSAGAGFTYLRRSSDSQPGEYAVRVTQARTRGQIGGAQAAEALTAAETVTITLDTDGDGAGVGQSLDVALQVGDSAAQQIQRFNQAFADNDLSASAFLDANGRVQIRADSYGANYIITAQSSRAAGAGTSGIGDAPLTGRGADLEGTIGGRPARVIDGNHLKGVDGFDTEDIEVIIDDDTSGNLGRVRITDGLGEFFPDLIDGLTTGRGILQSRTEGGDQRIGDLEEQITKNQDRISKMETRLRRQFTNMEVELGKLQALGDYVTQQLAALMPQKK